MDQDHKTGIAIVGLVFGSPVVGAIGYFHPWVLVTVAAITGVVSPFWLLSRSRNKKGESATADPLLEQRVAQLEEEIKLTRRGQAQLEETVRWQAQMLHRTAVDSVEGAGVPAVGR